MQDITYFEVKDFSYDPETNSTIVIVRKSQDVTVRVPFLADEHRLKYALEHTLRPDHKEAPHKLHKVSQLVRSLNKPGVNAFDVIQVLDEVDHLLGSIEAILEPNRVPNTRMVRNRALQELTQGSHHSYYHGSAPLVHNPHSITPVSF